MSYNGSGTFTINTTGQPVVAGTVISSSAFNSLTNDLATGLTTAITKDGQTTTTARITFAQGLTSSLVTDSSSVSTGSIITAGGLGVAKALYVGTTANVASTTDSSSISTGSIVTAGGVGIAKNVYVGGTLNVTGATTLTNPVINNIKMGYTTTATAAGTTTLTVSSNYRQFFTGTLAQTIVLPVTSTLVTGMAYEIENNSTGTLTVNSSGGNLVGTVPAGVCAHAVCIGTTLTTAADWDWDYISTTTITGTGANVLGTSPTITTPTISSLSSAAATALTLQSAGTTAITVDTSQKVGIGTTSPTGILNVKGTGGDAMPATSGSTQSAGLVTRLQQGGGIGSVMDIGGNGGGGSWIQVTEASNLATNYNLLLNPNGGSVLIGKTTAAGGETVRGCLFTGTGRGFFTADAEEPLFVNRLTNDGTLVVFTQAGTTEGTISVSGTTVSYNGGHLSRWAQTIAAKDDSLVKGTVLSNLDAMNVYTDVEGNPVDNEQLNKVKVSDVEGDANVAGVFVNWSYDEAHQVDEINMAMTGDMIIRIAQGVTVQRGDLLMSAGDGTAKPQGDDIVRSKTVAKVTSNHVTCTYADGSYCVPCVLMAC